MAPGKFGLFKSRSREQAEQPSTENLLKSSSQSSDCVNTPDSPVPSTSKGYFGDNPFMNMSVLSLDSDDEVSSVGNSRRGSQDSKEAVQIYRELQNPSDVTSTSTLEDVDSVQAKSTLEEQDVMGTEDDATSCDATSLQFDESSLAASDDMSMYCALMKKPKRGKAKEQKMKDFEMWTASNFEVMQNLLNRSGTVDEQIKWEAVATSRGLCTLTDCCTCVDCRGAKYLTVMSDGDAGMGAAPLFSAMNGCVIH